jgi:hypothetical protein
MVDVTVFKPEELAAVPVYEGFFTSNGFCRTGPSTIYNALIVFEEGHQVNLEARSEPDLPLWWYIYDQVEDIYCWVSSVVIETDVDPELLTVRDTPPLDPAAAPSESGELVCHAGLSYNKCIKAGGTWYVPIKKLADPFCQCP